MHPGDKISAPDPSRFVPVSGTRTGCLVALALGLIVATGGPEASASISIPAEFMRQLDLPGSADAFLRPAAIFVDRTAHEVLVADTGHNRIVILDCFGTYKHAFPGGNHFSSPVGVAVDSEGYIYVLGSIRGGRKVAVFDYDGQFLTDLDLSDTPDGPPVDIHSLAIGDNDDLLVLDRGRARICSYDRTGRFLSAFPLLADHSEEARRKAVFGSIQVSGETIFVPISSLGTVHLYDRSGKRLGGIGYRGNNVGELNFPVSVAVKDGDLVMVLDKHRFNVLCFTLDGKFLGEFGGKGSSPGWFYHPTLLAADDHDQIYVGQIFQSKIQVCRMPESIAAGIMQARSARQPQGKT
jgi:DNA-binding beta-propeller fold protein YncE